MDRSKIIVDHLTKEQVDRSNLSKFQQFKIEKEYMTSAYKNYLAHQLFYTVSMLTRTIYQSVLYEYAEAMPPEKWAMIDLLDEVISDSEERFETGQESVSQEEESSNNNNSNDGSDSSSDPWIRLGEETKEGGPKDPAIKFPGIDIKIDLPPTIFTPYDHTKNDLAQEARTNADKARAEADRQHEQAKQAQEAKQAAMDAAKAAKEDVERKAEALDKLVTEHKSDLVGSAKDDSEFMIETGGRIALTDSFVVARHNENAKAAIEAQKEAIEQFKEDLKNGVPRDEALERAQEKLETGVRDYQEVYILDNGKERIYDYTDVPKEQTIEETIKALEEYADAKEKEAEAAKEQSEALTQAGIESAKEEMAEERAQAAERAAEQAEREAEQESEITSSFDDTTNTTTTTDTETIEDEPTTCSSDSLPCVDCGSDSLPCEDCSSDCTSDCSSDCPSDCGTDCASDVEECGGCDCDDCGSLGVD